MALVKFNKTKHQLPAASVKLLTATSSALRSVDADEALKVQFKAECKQVLITILEKFMERFPLSYKMCRAAIAISPERMVLTKKNPEMKFSAICRTLFDSHYVSSEDADKAKEQYLEFLDIVVLPNREMFLAFNIEKDRLDTFLAARVEKVSTLSNVMIFVLTMFRGQSNVDRGFNINDDIVVDNLEKASLIAERLIYDHMHAKEVATHDMVLTDKLRRSSLAFSSKRKQTLAENKKQKVLSEKEKTKERLTEEIGKVLQQVEAVKAMISKLDRKVAGCYDKAEEAGADVLTIVAKGKALRRAATEKRKLVYELQIATKN